MLPSLKILLDVLTGRDWREVRVKFTSDAPIGWILSRVTNPIKCGSNQAILRPVGIEHVMLQTKHMLPTRGFAHLCAHL